MLRLETLSRVFSVLLLLEMVSISIKIDGALSFDYIEILAAWLFFRRFIYL